jgi:hypothetical protein
MQRVALREFRDRHGVNWRVCDVYPDGCERRHHRGDSAYAGPERRVREEVRERNSVREGFERGWLVFDSRAERRRLVPIPEGWERLSPARLEFLCANAISSGPPRRLP